MRVAGLLLLLFAAVARADSPSPAVDTLRFRFEVGASSDYTNEIYYLDSLATPTLAQRQRFDIPEARYAGVALATLEGTRAHGGTGYSLTQEFSLGDLLQRASLFGRWRQALGPDWRLLLAPRAQYRRDRTLGRDFEEYQAAGAARFRRSVAEGATAAELGVQGDWLETKGAGTGLLLDRWSAGAGAALEQSDFEGVDWRLDYTFRGRGFPDSSVRDHVEHETQGRARIGWGIAHFAVLDAMLMRRFTVRTVPNSQDNFWEESGALEVVHNSAGALGWPTRIDFEAVQFDVEDDVLYFDHQLLRARSGARLQPSSPWTLEIGPQAEWLAAERAPDEAYLELGGFAEFEAIYPGTLWSLTPSAGHRRYRATRTATLDDPYTSGRSSYQFVQFDVLGDQRLPGGWRARAGGSARWEFHDDSVENAGSLYFSLDVRRLF
ncbi:MAG: hypothetical protein ABIS67_12430 [Candidatus Eisenbacteria bacterium]